jgi:hypothetical protein
MLHGPRHILRTELVDTFREFGINFSEILGFILTYSV